jgi:uncharacterized protein YggT (Ycf19 family)
MNLIDFILNLSGLLLWLNWRSLRFDPLVRPAPVTLAGTVRRAEPRRLKGWQLLAALAGLLLFRSVIYAQIGPAASWTPRVDCGAISLAFRTDSRLMQGFGEMLLYSLLSFARMLAIFYVWLLVLAMLNRSTPEGEPLHKVVRLHLGWAAKWPVWVQFPLPLLLLTGLWLLLHPALVWAGSLTPAESLAHVLEQGLVVGLALYLTLKYLLPVILLLYLVTSYVYLGTSPLWDYLNATARQMLSPLRRLPLRLGRVDFAPVLAAALLLLLFEALPMYLLGKYPDLRGRLWPQ